MVQTVVSFGEKSLRAAVSERGGQVDHAWGRVPGTEIPEGSVGAVGEGEKFQDTGCG